MILVDRSGLLAGLMLAATLAACGGGDETATGEPEATAEAPEATSAPPAAVDGCVPEADIVAIVEHPVQSKPGGALCFYETADFSASVTMMRIASGQADQVLQEMRDAAAPYGAEVGEIEVGDRGHAWGSPGYGQGYAVAGDGGWIVDVSVPAGDPDDKRDDVIEILERVTR
jgi:hypothetical protein